MILLYSVGSVKNTKKHERKIRVIVDHSFNALRALVSKSGGPDPEPVFDLAFIDGSHVARDVLTDALLLWPYIKPGGYMVFDDYEWMCIAKLCFVLRLQSTPSSQYVAMN